MKILRLEAKHIRGLPDRTFHFTDPRSGLPLDVVLVTGGPGAGKTSLLEAIAAAKEATGSYGSPLDPMRLARPGTRDARIAVTWLLSDAERDRARLDKAEQTAIWNLGTGAPRAEAEAGLRRVFAEHSCAPDRGKLEYFPADRGLNQGAHPAFARTSKEAVARVRATRSPDKYACLVDALREPALEEAARTARMVKERGVALRPGLSSALVAYEEAVAAMVPELRLGGFDLSGGGGLRFTRRSGEVLSLADLPHSEQQGVLVALAVVYFGLQGSLLLIDEPELHIHASQRVRFLHALVSLAKDNQIVAATGSAEIVAAASPGQVLDLARPATA